MAIAIAAASVDDCDGSIADDEPDISDGGKVLRGENFVQAFSHISSVRDFLQVKGELLFCWAMGGAAL